MTLLQWEIVNFGAYICAACKGTPDKEVEHSKCAHWGGAYGEDCVCKKHNHDVHAAAQDAFDTGRRRLKALAHS